MITDRPPIVEPPGLHYLPYQRQGINYILQGRGTLLADEMGLGKTIQAIGAINSLKGKWHILCPAFLRMNWFIELKKWLIPEISLDDIHVVPYTQVHRVSPDDIENIILDEAHYLKNWTAKRSQATERLAKKAKRIIAMTGTPIENRPVEIWNLLRMVCPEEWEKVDVKSYIIAPEAKESHPGHGPAFWQFAKRYCDLKKVYHTYNGRRRSAWSFDGASNLVELGTRLRDTCMVRRLKKDVLKDLPPKRYTLVHLEGVKVSPEPSYVQNSIYGLDYEEAVKKLRSTRVAFEAWSKTRKECGEAKVDVATQFIENILEQKNQVIVFAYHQSVAERIHEILTAQDYDSVLVTGKTPVDERQEAVDAFQGGRVRAFVGTIGACGVGFTLTSSDTVVFVEFDPNPGKMTQAADRAHRMGQKNCVDIYHLIVAGTIDANLVKMLVKKQEIQESILSESVLSKEYSREEI